MSEIIFLSILFSPFLIAIIALILDEYGIKIKYLISPEKQYQIRE